jgi:nitrite reductase (cytochrome c-552)
MGFHAPGEALRILGESINLSRQGQLALRDPSYRPSFESSETAPAPPPGSASTTARSSPAADGSGELAARAGSPTAGAGSR